VWTAVIGTLLMMAISLPEAVYRYSIDARTLSDGERYLPVEQNLNGSLWGFVLVPIIGLPFGVLGAAAGRALRRRAPAARAAIRP
jgi:hypothetical protein